MYSESFSEMAADVSLMILDTVLALIRKENVNDCCESPEAKNLRVNAKRLAGSRAFLKFVSVFLIDGPTSESRCSKRPGDILRNLKTGLLTSLAYSARNRTRNLGFLVISCL